jgi:hypothetical protein
MTNRTNAVSMSTSLPRRPRMRVAGGAGVRRIRTSLWAPAPTMEEVEERLRGYRGFFAALTPEQLAIWESLDEFGAICGDPNAPKRTY